MNLKIVFCFLFIILCVFEESDGGVVGLEKRKSRENGEKRLFSSLADVSGDTNLPRTKRTGNGSKHLAYLMNFRTGKNSGRKQIKNIESKTYVVDTNKQTKQLRRDRLLIDNLIKSMVERGLLEPVTKESHRESRRKNKRSFKTKRFQANVHEVHHNRNAHRHNPHRVRDENIAERKHEPHPASRPTLDYTYDDGSESEEILLLEQVKDHEKTDLKGDHRENKKTCYSNVYKNVLEAFQEALKKQISSYKSCVCRHNKNRHFDKNPSSSKGHKSELSAVEDLATTEIATTTIMVPDNLSDIGNENDQHEEHQGPTALQETLLQNGDDVVCFHKENAVILSELLKYLKFNETEKENHEIIEAQPFREDHRHPQEHHVRGHQQNTHHHGHSHGHKKNQATGSHATHHNHQHHSHDRGSDRVSRHYNNLDNSEEVDPIVMSNSHFQTVPLTTTARAPRYQENEIEEETRALTDIMKMVATLQDMYKPDGQRGATNLVEESDEAPRFIKSDETSGSEFSGPDDNEKSYAKFVNDELKSEINNIFRGSKPTDEKPFQDPSGNTIQKPQRKNDFHTNAARKVRQDEGSSYESIRKSEKSFVQSSQKSTKQQRSASRPSSLSKSSVDSRKKLSLAVQIPEASRGIVSKIKYELE